MEGLVVDESQPEIPRIAPPDEKLKKLYNYTEFDLAKREKAINDGVRDHPKLPPKWIEWLYDIVENKPKEEVEKIINEKLWEKPIKQRELGGVIKGALEVLPPPPPQLTDSSGN